MIGPMRPTLINGRIVSPVHYSPANGVHADVGKLHVPYVGQTTINTFRTNELNLKQAQENDLRLKGLGGTLINDIR